MIQGLTYTYGISKHPRSSGGTTFTFQKGPIACLQGWDGISGQINVETKDPGKSEKFFLNIYLKFLPGITVQLVLYSKKRKVEEHRSFSHGPTRSEV